MYEGVEIIDVAAEGKSIAKVDGMTLFVPFAIPGDVVDVQPYRKRKSFAEGKVIRFVEYSKDRGRACVRALWGVWWMQMANVPYRVATAAQASASGGQPYAHWQGGAARGDAHIGSTRNYFLETTRVYLFQ